MPHFSILGKCSSILWKHGLYSIHLVVGIGNQIQLQQQNVLVFLHHLSDWTIASMSPLTPMYPQLMGTKKVDCFFDSFLLMHLAVNHLIIFPIPHPFYSQILNLGLFYFWRCSLIWAFATFWDIFLKALLRQFSKMASSLRNRIWRITLLAAARWLEKSIIRLNSALS